MSNRFGSLCHFLISFFPLGDTLFDKQNNKDGDAINATLWHAQSFLREPRLQSCPQSLNLAQIQMK